MTDPLAPLRDRFRRRAGEDLERAQRLWAIDPSSEDMRRLVHDLAGAAGMFGYPALSDAALVMDRRYASGEIPDPAQMALFVARLRDAAA